MPPRRATLKKRARKAPRRKTVRRKFAKKSVRKRAGHKMTTMRAGPFYNSDRAHVKMVIAEDEFKEELVATAGTPQRLTYALNGIYDPYLGAGGGSVSGYSLMSSQYGYSMVKGSKMELTIRRTTDTADNGPYDVCLIPIPSSGSSSLPSSMATMKEQPYAKFIPGVSIGADKAHRITSYMSVTKIEGLKDIYAPSYRAATGSNPSIIPVWMIGLQMADPSQTTLTISVIVSVKITYYVEWFNRLTNPGSFIDKVLKKAIETGLVDELKKEVSPSSPVIPRKKNYIKDDRICDHKEECKCSVLSKVLDEDSDLDEEYDDMPTQTPSKGRHHQPVIPPELPPKAAAPEGPVPARAPASTPPPGGPASSHKVRRAVAILDHPVSTQVLRK